MSARQRGIDADIYGTLSFGNGRPASWMRVNGTENDPKRFWSIASTAWELDKPKMIISVIGSGASLKLSPKVRENFGRGLVNAVLSTQAWVITSGIDVGISKEVGDAVRKSAKTNSQTWQEIQNPLLLRGHWAVGNIADQNLSLLVELTIVPWST